MGVDLEFVDRETYLEIIVTGAWELEDAKGAFVAMMERCAEQHPTLILIDVRQLVVGQPISLRERFDFVQSAVRTAIHYRAHGLAIKRTAFLGADAHIDPKRFGQTVASNRGVMVYPTTSEAAALAHLGVAKAEKSDPANAANPPA